MDFQIHSLNQLLISIAETKNKLSKIEENINNLKEKIIALNNEFLNNEYKNFDILPPLSYIPNRFEIKETEGDLHFNVLPEHCLKIKSSKYPDEIIKVVLLPSPARFVVYLLRTHKELVWKVND